MPNLIPRWSGLKKLTDSKLAKLSIIVPVIGWLLIYNDNFVQIWTQVWGMSAEPDLSWKLYVFYIGLVFISISAVIFIALCPDTIKRHDQEIDYIDFQRKTYTRFLDQRVSSHLGIAPINWSDPEEQYSENGSYPLIRIYEVNEEKIVDQLTKIFHLEDQLYMYARLTCLVSFAVGAIMTTIPTLTTVAWAIPKMISLI